MKTKKLVKIKKSVRPYKFDRINFWMDPTNSGAPEKRIKRCRPEFYLNLDNVSKLVVSTLERYILKKDMILEIGCGTGRNLVALKKAGYKKLTGIELSPKTVEVGKEHFPEYKKIQLLIGPVEKMIEEVGEFDVIFTSGLLMHIPPEHEWLFERIAQKARKLIMVNEGESPRAFSEHAWNRNYQDIFERLGWTQVEMETGDHYPPLPATTIKRVFVKPTKTLLGFPIVESDEVSKLIGDDPEIILGTYDDLGKDIQVPDEPDLEDQESKFQSEFGRAIAKDIDHQFTIDNGLISIIG
jgi:SAM-dependent methyltransferase